MAVMTDAEIRRKNADYMREWFKSLPDDHKARIIDRQHRWRKANPDREHQHARTYRQSIRRKVFDHYGQQCACCGSCDRLTIDHIGTSGRAHRIELFGRAKAGSYHFYLWLIRQGFPDGYQTLCNRCNSSKGDTTACRLNHQEEAP